MQNQSQIPSEIRERLRGAFLAVYGGPGTFDCWLTRMADQLAPRQAPGPARVNPALVPPEFQVLMHRPGEVADYILGRLDRLGIFVYRATVMARPDGSVQITVKDQASGHILETVNGPDGAVLAAALREKYGDYLEVVSSQ